MATRDSSAWAAVPGILRRWAVQCRPSAEVHTAGSMPWRPTATKRLVPAATPSSWPGSAAAGPEAAPAARVQVRRSRDDQATGNVPALVVALPTMT